MPEPLQAFRQLEIDVELIDGKILPVLVPFTVQLLFDAEETLQKANARPWSRIRPKDESVVNVFIDFCKKSLPDSFDYTRVDPTFPALFFAAETRVERFYREVHRVH